MKKQVIYIHGGDSFTKREDFLNHLKVTPIWNLPGKENTLSWKGALPKDLGEDYEVYLPSMPNKQNADYEEWVIWFERHFEYLRNDVILVGCSLGGMFLAKYLSENTLSFKPKALFLLAAPCGTFATTTGDDCGNFQFNPEILTKLSENIENITLFHSKDDFVVPYEHVLEYKKYLPNAELVTYSDKNHFLIPEFPELLDKIRHI